MHLQRAFSPCGQYKFVLSIGLYGILLFGNMGKINKGEVTEGGENEDAMSESIQCQCSVSLLVFAKHSCCWTQLCWEHLLWSVDLLCSYSKRVKTCVSLIEALVTMPTRPVPHSKSF